MSLYFEVYNPLKKWKKGDYPVSPQVTIRLAMYRTESDGGITFAPYMATEQEIDHTITYLIKELEEVRRKAKKELKSTLEKQLGTLKKKT